MIEVYEYSYIDKPRITSMHVNIILDHASKGSKLFPISLDLGLTKSNVYFDESFRKVNLGGYWISLDVLASIKGNTVYEVIGDDEIKPIIIRTKHSFYKLMAINGNASPTLEINGIHMHRVKGITPWEDSKIKVKKAKVRKRHIVLDTCTGLGYTAILSLLHGAARVYTVEVDENVLEIAQHNPWSRLLERKDIIVIKGDVYEVIDFFPDDYFHRIIHDPPRFTSTTGHLYSEDFYRKLYRILRKKGILFHYTGEPGKHRMRFIKGVMERLRRAGFYPVRWIEESKGVIAYKMEW